MAFLTQKSVWVSAGLLGLTLSFTGCATANSQIPQTAFASENALAHGQMMPPHGDIKKRWGKNHHADYRAAHKTDRHAIKMGGMGMPDHLKTLNLTPIQKTQIQQLRAQNHTKMQQLHTTLKQYDETIAKRKQLGASTAELLTLYQQKQAAMAQFFTLRQQQQQQFLNILTPEQQLKLYESHHSHGSNNHYHKPMGKASNGLTAR